MEGSGEKNNFYSLHKERDLTISIIYIHFPCYVLSILVLAKLYLFTFENKFREKRETVLSRSEI